MSSFKARLRNSRVYPKLLKLKKIPFYIKDRLSSKRSSTDSFCKLPWTEIGVLCDGTVVCGCFDVMGAMPLGNVENQSVKEIWWGPRFQKLRKSLLSGAEHVHMCSTCCFRKDRPSGEQVKELYPVEPENWPKLLQVEPTIRCNLRCTAWWP